MTPLARALLDELDDEALTELARRLAPLMPAPSAAPDDRWLCTKDAAVRLGVSVHALHRLTAKRAIPFSQAQSGGKTYFQTSELDRWRASQGGS